MGLATRLLNTHQQSLSYYNRFREFTSLGYADTIVSAEDFSIGNNSAALQTASELASTYFQNQSSTTSAGLSSGAIAGIIIAVIVVVLLLVAIIAVAGFTVHSQRSKK